MRVKLGVQKLKSRTNLSPGIGKFCLNSASSFSFIAFKISFLLFFSMDFAFNFTPLIVKFDGYCATAVKF